MKNPAQDLGIEIIDEATFMALLPDNAGARASMRSSERTAEAGSEGLSRGLIGREPQGDNRGAEPTSNARVARDSGEPTLPGNDDGVLFEPTLF